MKQIINDWIQRYLGDPEFFALFFVLAIIVVVFAAFGQILMPVLASIVITYLLQTVVKRLEGWRCPHIVAVLLVYLLFVGLVVFALFGLLPLLWRQLSSLVNELPNTLGRGQAFLMQLPVKYPDYISAQQLQQFMGEAKLEITHVGQVVLSASLASIPSVIELIVYLVMVPLLVYFFLMDRSDLLAWISKYLPQRRKVIREVWQEVHLQIGKYVGGKFIEMIIVGVVTYGLFLFMGLQYSFLLAALVGLSVIVPYIGAIVVTVPILMIAFFQWGWSAQFAYLVVAYGIIVALDANLLVPLLFSEVVNLHPVAIIIATLVFGKIWGFWGVFFAIPLAILVKAILGSLSAKSTARVVKETKRQNV